MEGKRMPLLNDDCLLEIFSYLGLADQFRATQAHPHFKQLMPIVWRKSCTNLDISLFGLDFDMDDFKTIIDCVFKTVQQIRDRRMTSEKFDILMQYIFPKVRDFSFYKCVFQRSLQDDAIIQIVKAFPNLQVFRPTGEFTGKYFTEIALENLCLSFCDDIFFAHNLEKILEKTQLKILELNLFRTRYQPLTLPAQHLTKLEGLKVNDYELQSFLGHLANMENLKNLVVIDGCLETLAELSNSLTESQRNNLSLLQIRNLESCLSHIEHFKTEKLLIAYNVITLVDMEDVTPYAFYNLREVYFKSCCFGKKAHLASLMYNIVQAEVLCLERCQFLFTEFYILVHRIARNRTKKLKLKLFKNKEDLPISWTLCGKSRLFEMSTNEGSGNIFTSFKIQLKFK